jgi:hypothetical protein
MTVKLEHTMLELVDEPDDPPPSLDPLTNAVPFCVRVPVKLIFENEAVLRDVRLLKAALNA